MNTILWIVQAILAVMFLFAGVMKVFQYERAKASWPWVKEASRGFVSFVGIVDLFGAIGIVLPKLTGILPWLTPLAAVGLAVLMLLATIFHVRRGENSVIGFNLFLLVLYSNQNENRSFGSDMVEYASE